MGKDEQRNGQPECRGPWAFEEVATWLDGAVIPLRLAALRSDGFPLLASHWFLRDGTDLLCAVHGDSLVARTLGRNPRCAFEIAPNDPPYHGVRGRALATLTSAGAASLLDRLIGRFLGDRDQKLADWLRSRADQELLVRLTPSEFSSWDYRDRMAG